MSTSAPLNPTYRGYIASTQDALILFEACLSGTLNHVARRPHDRERSSLIKSGNVFIYEEYSSGIKRWTDGVPWSPSRILGNFLIYRELEHAFPPGEKKRAMKRDKRAPGISKTIFSYGKYAGNQTGRSLASQESQRYLVGSLTDSYEFKSDGLVKKTLSVAVGGVSHHLVSYYNVDDVLGGRFCTPTKDSRFHHVMPRLELTTQQSFRTPLDEAEPIDRMNDRNGYNQYGYGRPGYELTNQSILQRPSSLPTQGIPYSNAYSSAQSLYSPVYGIASTSSSFDNSISSQASPTSYTCHYTPVTGLYSAAPRADSYDQTTNRQRLYSPDSANSTRSMMPIQTQLSRRSSVFDHSCGPSDSGASTGSIKSEHTTNSSYSSQGAFNPRDTSNQHQVAFAAQRALPSLMSSDDRQSAYDRVLNNNYVPIDSIQKDHAWSMGNLSTAHAHYTTPQTQWAGTSST